MPATSETAAISALRIDGWQGFERIGAFVAPYCNIPNVKGVYLTLCEGEKCPTILKASTGGWFKGRNPTVDPALLAARWVEGTPILYIGKAGGSGHATLRKRLRQYLEFGRGKPVGHWGGRYIWQLANAADLLVCWKPLPQSDPIAEERRLLREFVTTYGTLPFANLKVG